MPTPEPIDRAAELREAADNLDHADTCDAATVAARYRAAAAPQASP